MRWLSILTAITLRSSNSSSVTPRPFRGEGGSVVVVAGLAVVGAGSWIVGGGDGGGAAVAGGVVGATVTMSVTGGSVVTGGSEMTAGAAVGNAAGATTSLLVPLHAPTTAAKATTPTPRVRRAFTAAECNEGHNDGLPHFRFAARSGTRRSEMQGFDGRSLDRGGRPRHRNSRSALPRFELIGVMRADGVARLPSRERKPASIPMPDVDSHS